LQHENQHIDLPDLGNEGRTDRHSHAVEKAAINAKKALINDHIDQPRQVRA
jgi:hypothetical protein